jgi:hypothetical protein
MADFLDKKIPTEELLKALLEHHFKDLLWDPSRGYEEWYPQVVEPAFVGLEEDEEE